MKGFQIPVNKATRKAIARSVRRSEEAEAMTEATGFYTCKAAVLKILNAMLGDRSCGADMAAHYDAALSAAIQRVDQLEPLRGRLTPKAQVEINRCDGCDNGVEPEWIVCPYCGMAQSSNDAEFGTKP